MPKKAGSDPIIPEIAILTRNATWIAAIWAIQAKSTGIDPAWGGGSGENFGRELSSRHSPPAIREKSDGRGTRRPVLSMEEGRLGMDAGQRQPSLASGRSGTMIVVLRWALTAGLLFSLAFCVIGFLITFSSPTDRFCPCVYSILIVLYGMGTARLLRPVIQRA
jgi:hypothetical protein